MKPRKLRTLKGFPDYLPDDMRLRQFIINNFIQVFESYGYEPLETPALEYADTLLGISGDEAEKLMYRFKDAGGRDVVMRYEVMVPMCRVIAQNRDKIKFPFKRYQIQRVWRAENTQKGRLREFTQCDADTIGSPSMLADAEFIQMGIQVLQNLGFKDFEVRISNRKLLYGILEASSLDNSSIYSACMAIDDLEKIGSTEVIKKLTKTNLPKSEATDLVKSLTQPLDYFTDKYSANDQVKESLEETRQILDYLKTSQVDPSKFRFDPSIARGLAHYTGPIWEFSLTKSGLGSLAGSGRYDNVIGNYLGTSDKIPATGGSFGIERLMIAMKEMGLVKNLGTTSAQVMVAYFSPDLTDQTIELANQLRDKGVNTFLYPDSVKLAKQFKFANQKNIPFVVIIGEQEASDNKLTLKDMRSGNQETLTLDQAISRLKSK